MTRFDRGLGVPRIAIAVVVLGLLRCLAGVIFPLSADEAYCWLWSKHLAAGYYDHPPAIAFLIRAGTAVFGDTPLGVRFLPLLLSFAASGFVWRAGARLFDDDRIGALACLAFNLTLMVAVETMAATPDAPLIACAAAFVWALTELWDTQDGRWWIVVGFAGGLALLSKYTGFFLGVGAVAWLVLSPRARHWLWSPWPYAGALVALLVFAPNLWWNAQHGWMTFAFQFGRIGAGHFTLRYLVEFLAAQLLLATPFILLCALSGVRDARRDDAAAFLAVLAAPSIVYFAMHSLHDRVQGNWPCFLYPVIAIAAGRVLADLRIRSGMVTNWSRRLAVPVAAAMLAACYAQVFFDIVPIGRSDPASRLLAFGIRDVAGRIEGMAGATGAGIVLTTDYATTSWLRFYTNLNVIQIDDDQRWLTAPRADARLFGGPLLYISEDGRDRHDLIETEFAATQRLGNIDRKRAGVVIASYAIYRVSGLRGVPVGRVP